MRLTKIKLAGFKSFVDPTEIKLPTSLVGIVGPNGCGKSNIIDAVRWVMGESSAKHLRGDSMDDVIFTGSSQRKPVGQASVELVFDNADGSLGGEYATYAEISIKREVTRDGQSKYSLNNTRCRRRDIRDIFLGTGLGPRSYAIIEQGMISRLIDAKPEELRVYLEEAAGISKYKERRKETENRIRHTRDNLDRLDDLREEVDKQLAHLQRQAQTAERYQTFKTEERQKRGELLGLRRKSYIASKDQQAAGIAAREAELEGIMAEVRSAEAAIEQTRTQQTDTSDSFNQVQANFYSVGADVSRVEQQIEHARESHRQQSQEFSEVERSLQEARDHQLEDTKRISEIVTALETDQPSFEHLKDSQNHSAELHLQAERELQQWQVRHDAFNHRNAESMRTAQVERSRIDQLERGIANADARLERLQAELTSIDIAPLTTLIEQAIIDEVAAAAEETRWQESLESGADKQQHLRESLSASSDTLNTLRSQSQTLIGRLASLEALQQAALQPDSNAADAWLSMNQLDNNPRLAQSITAAPGWEKAVELVLGPHLEAVCVQGADAIKRCLKDVPAAQLTLLEAGAADSAASSDSLRSKVTGDVPLNDLMKGVYAADDLSQALAIRKKLGDGESIITRDGMWLGQHWLRVARADAQDSVLLRETEINKVRDELKTLTAKIAESEATQEELETQQQEHEARRETTQRSFNDSVRLTADLKSTLLGHRQKLEQQTRRKNQLSEELAETTQLKEQDDEQRTQAETNRSAAITRLDELKSEENALSTEQETLQTAVAEARARAEADRDAGQELAIRVESMRSAKQATEQNLSRMQSRITQLEERHAVLSELLASNDDDPVSALDDKLKGLLSGKLAAETALTTSRAQLDEVESRLREHEQARVRHDSRSQQVRETLQNERMESQEALVRLKTIDEQLAEHDFDIETLMNEVPEGADIDEWASDLEKLEQRIQRLGNINLAAIDELAEQSARKEYLDTQYNDVTEALATLEQAIAKIDRETRARFKETFDLVSAKISDFFPRLFGGGHAKLEMTGDDLLNTGVNVVAQPPGKRVNNIQLLSGGEKALTAVAMVFAFFELNPSPFCMLDEVDAPLDDANVGRFCELVKEMSERVQFIFITHNKVTMEMANQLLGVTMNEPGVSRLVAVDVQEAVELVGE
ncbi:MAG: chromosome segregation protein SMC [Granulosicoccaceae bacterium]